MPSLPMLEASRTESFFELLIEFSRVRHKVVHENAAQSPRPRQPAVCSVIHRLNASKRFEGGLRSDENDPIDFACH